jgi:ATP/ADP translocase
MLRLAEVHPDERRVVAGAFLTLFGILAAHTVLETARDALFLAHLPASQLPWVYLAMAGVAVGLSQVSWHGPRLAGRYILSALLLVLAAGTLAFWAVGGAVNHWLLRALYVWTGLVGSLAGLQFWLVLGETYTITQAKRLYRIIGTGSLLGAVAGAGLARAVSMRLDAPSLLLLAALLLALTALGPALLLRRPEGGAQGVSTGRWTFAQAASLFEGQAYVTRLAGLVLISTVALTLGDYVFKSAVVRSVPAESLGRFFATFYMVLNLLALCVQLVFAGWLFRVFGLHRALWALPAVLFFGAAGVALGGGLVAALLLKGADGMLRPSVHRTGTELLFLPIPDALRARVKPLIDVVGQRGGQAIASVFILSELALHGDTALAGGAAFLCVVWIAWAADLRLHYVEMFRSALREGAIERSGDLPELDLGSLEALFAALNSQDDAEVVAALDLLASEGRVRLIPALILYHPSQAVVLRALELFETSGRGDFVPIADRLLDRPAPELRAAALRARSAVAPDQKVLRKAMDDASPFVRATAVVGLVAGGWVSDEAQAALDALLAEGSLEARLALARAIQQRPTPAFEAILLDLAQSPEPGIQASVARAMGALQNPRFLPALLPLLASHNARREVRAAFVAFGKPGLRFADEALADLTLPHEIRRHVPRTLSRFPAADAAPLLLQRLIEEPDGMVRFKILRGLGRLAARHPEVSLDRAMLQTAIERTLRAAFRLAQWRRVLERGALQEPARRTRGQELLATLLADKGAHTLERVFRLLSLRYRRENFERIYRGLRNANPKIRASSRELLENLVRAPLRGPVLALVDEAPDAEPSTHAAAYSEAEPLDYEALLVTLLEQPGETLRSLAAYHVGELGLRTLRGQIDTLRSRETGLFVGRILERTLRVLEAPVEGLTSAG